MVKADAYGLGISEAAKALYEAGAKNFFVAHLSEALALRKALEKPAIYVLNGFFPECADSYAKERISPVLNTLSQVEAWAKLPATEKSQGAALHVDTGMSRLGLHVDEYQNLKSVSTLGLNLIMSHLACADTPEHALNAAQLETFKDIATDAAMPASLANSAGIFLDKGYAFNLTRPGIALYGSFPGPNAHGLKPVITLNARVLQIRRVKKGETVGYGAAFTAHEPRTIATLACGYADGFLRSSYSSFAAYEGVKYPLAGRISMDLIAVDITDAPKSLREGDFMELIGETVKIDDVAEKAGTIAYEFLTGLGKRYQRSYVGR